MIVTMSMVFDGLSKRFACEKGDSYSPDHAVMGAFPASDHAVGHERWNVCYVCEESVDSAMIPNDAKIAIVHASGRKPSCAIVVLTATSAEEVRAAAAAVICAYTNWADELLTLSLHKSGLEELLDLAHTIFGNPMNIVDQDYRVLAHTHIDSMEDSLWITTCGASVDQAEGIVLIASEEDRKGFLRYLEELRCKEELFGYRTTRNTLVTACLIRKTHTSLMIVNIVQKNRAVTDGDLACLRYFSKILGSKLKAIEFTWHHDAQGYDALLQDILRGNLSAASDAKERLGEVWSQMLPYFTVLVIDARDGFLRYNQLCQVEDDLAGIAPQAKSVIHARKLVLFVNHVTEDPAIELEGLEAYLCKHDLIMGVSDSRDVECSLHDLVSQARIALRVGQRCFPDRTIFPYRDCRVFYLFDLALNRGDWRRAVHPLVWQLIEHDATAKVPLMPTLRSLVQNGGNRIATASHLAIRRNTLQYRIGKIESIGQVDLSDEAAFDHVATSLSLLDYCLPSHA